jgi:hypothetical protein
MAFFYRPFLEGMFRWKGLVVENWVKIGWWNVVHEGKRLIDPPYPRDFRPRMLQL